MQKLTDIKESSPGGQCFRDRYYGQTSHFRYARAGRAVININRRNQDIHGPERELFSCSCNPETEPDRSSPAEKRGNASNGAGCLHTVTSLDPRHHV